MEVFSAAQVRSKIENGYCILEEASEVCSGSDIFLYEKMRFRDLGWLDDIKGASELSKDLNKAGIDNSVAVCELIPKPDGKK